jgi:hypothetical protein
MDLPAPVVEFPDCQLNWEFMKGPLSPALDGTVTLSDAQGNSSFLQMATPKLRTLTGRITVALNILSGVTATANIPVSISAARWQGGVNFAVFGHVSGSFSSRVGWGVDATNLDVNGNLVSIDFEWFNGGAGTANGNFVFYVIS